MTKSKKQVARVGSVNSAIDQAQQWLKQAIEKYTEKHIEKLIKASQGALQNANLTEDRRIFRSRFTEKQQEIADHYSRRSVTPLNQFYPYAGALDLSTQGDKIQLENLMNSVQLSECADAFFADGVLRSLIGKQIDFVLPDRTKAFVRTDPTWEENKNNLAADFAKQFKELKPQEIAEYNVRVSRLMERLHMWDREIKLLVTAIIFGRNSLFITRDKTEEKGVYSKFGKPKSLTLLNAINIKKAMVDNDQQFQGIVYDWGVSKRNNVPIDKINLIPFFYDDFNIYQNTYFSGMTRIFSLIGIAHSNQLINTYDLPKATMLQYSGTSFVYAGEESKILAKQFARTVKEGVNFHDKPMLKVEEAQAAKNIINILDTRDRNYQAMSMILGIPIFLLFGDSSNFATAAIAMQSYLNGTAHRLGTFFMDTLEEYFFMPLLADIANIDLDTLIDSYVNRVKAIKPKIDLQTKTDKFDNACKMWDRQVITTREQFLKYVGEDELAELAQPLDRLEEKLKTEQKKADIERAQAGIDPATGNGQESKAEGDMRMTATEAGKRMMTAFGVKKTTNNLQTKGAE